MKRSGHLNTEQMALYVDAMRLNKLEKIPNFIYQHVEECEQCRNHIMETANLVWKSKDIHLSKHPFFGKHNGKKKSLAEQQQTIEQEAPLCEHYENRIHNLITFRSENTTIPIQFKLPLSEQFFTNQVQFQFKTTKEYYFQIENSEQEMLYDAFFKAGQHNFNIALPKTSFPEGAYYYIFTNDRGVPHFIDKFYIYHS